MFSSPFLFGWKLVGAKRPVDGFFGHSFVRGPPLDDIINEWYFSLKYYLHAYPIYPLLGTLDSLIIHKISILFLFLHQVMLFDNSNSVRMVLDIKSAKYCRHVSLSSFPMSLKMSFLAQFCEKWHVRCQMSDVISDLTKIMSHVIPVISDVMSDVISDVI